MLEARLRLEVCASLEGSKNKGLEGLLEGFPLVLDLEGREKHAFKVANAGDRVFKYHPAENNYSYY